MIQFDKLDFFACEKKKKTFEKNVQKYDLLKFVEVVYEKFDELYKSH